MNRAAAIIVWSVLSLGAFGCGGGGSSPTNPSSSTPTTTTTTTTTPTTTSVTWSFNGSAWAASGTAPACPSPLVFSAPADVTKATAVLYPGQTRGGHYKAHGGFLFAVGTNTAITVTAPMAGYVHGGARYIESGEVQYIFDIINTCGVMHRLDHLLTLSAKFQAIADTFPAPGPSSAGTLVGPGTTVTEGEVIATAVGFRLTGNTSVDWGAYDLRARNAASSNAAWLAAHPGEQAPYALCWLNNLSSTSSALLRALPGADFIAGKTSDYCK